MSIKIQTHLVAGRTHLITWLPRDSRVRVGSKISIDNDDEIWTVQWQSQPTFAGEINRGWNVGGLK